VRLLLLSVSKPFSQWNALTLPISVAQKAKNWMPSPLIISSSFLHHFLIHAPLDMRMLEQGQEADTQVSWEDQQNINAFSKLSATHSELEDLYADKKRELEDLDDLNTELELCDLEDESDDENDDAETGGAFVPYRIGDSFMNVRVGYARKRLEQDKQKLSREVILLKERMEQSVQEMSKLKQILYSRFGNAINLEMD
jgi:prefoldin subunit 4